MGLFTPNVAKLEARKDLPGLVRALACQDNEVRERAVQALGRIGAPAVQPLIAALLKPMNDYGAFANRAADALGRIGAPAVEPLMAALRDGEAGVRSSAAQALGKIGDARAVESLIAALHGKYGADETVVQALGQIGDARAVGPLIAVLNSRTGGSSRRAAAEALGKIGNARAVQPLIAALKRIHDDSGALYMRELEPKKVVESLVRIGAPAVGGLIAALDDGTSLRVSGGTGWKHLREFVEDALVEIGAPAVEPLIAALKDRNHFEIYRAYWCAAEALGRIGDARAVGPLIDALKDDFGGVGLFAATALSRIGAPAVEKLTAVLRDRDLEARARAAKALDRIRTAAQ